MRGACGKLSGHSNSDMSTSSTARAVVVKRLCRVLFAATTSPSPIGGEVLRVRCTVDSAESVNSGITPGVVGDVDVTAWKLFSGANTRSGNALGRLGDSAVCACVADCESAVKAPSNGVIEGEPIVCACIADKGAKMLVAVKGGSVLVCACCADSTLMNTASMKLDSVAVCA